ncbi:putative acyl-CoA dehydrogenase domain protein [Mycobacterium xenopi 3993]|nr:putative acyl-CoA dehydrogenase domain protein [Mycobacterium xenopi 3993]
MNCGRQPRDRRERRRHRRVETAGRAGSIARHGAAIHGRLRAPDRGHLAA